MKLAKQIGKENFSFGIFLGLDRATVEEVEADHEPVTKRGFYMLLKWKQTKMNPDSVETLTELCNALGDLGRVDLVKLVKSGELMSIMVLHQGS